MAKINTYVEKTNVNDILDTDFLSLSKSSVSADTPRGIYRINVALAKALFGSGSGGGRSTYRGAYSTSATYKVGDIVLQDGKFYINKTAITAGEAFAEAKWFELGDGDHEHEPDQFFENSYAWSDDDFDLSGITLNNSNKVWTSPVLSPALIFSSRLKFLNSWDINALFCFVAEGVSQAAEMKVDFILSDPNGNLPATKNYFKDCYFSIRWRR